MQIELLESPSSFIYFPLDSLDNSANLHCSIRSPNICLIHYLLLFPFQLPIPLKPSIITTSLTSHLSHLKKSAQISSPLGLHASDPTWRPLPWIGGSTGSPFHIFPECVARVPVSLWGSGGWGCVRSTLRSRAQPFATVRNRSQPSARSPYGRAYGKFYRGGPFWRFHPIGQARLFGAK